MRFSMFFAIICTLGLPSTAVAAQLAQGPKVVAVDSTDPEDGTRITGVRVASENDDAFLFVWCDEDNTNPRIIFTHKDELDEPTKPVGVVIATDQIAPFEHFFTVMKNTRAGVFFVRTAQLYQSRFGEAPPVFLEGVNAVNVDYITWTDNIYNQLVADLFFAKWAIFQLNMTDGRQYEYRFQTVQLAENIGRLRGCYEAPVVRP